MDMKEKILESFQRVGFVVTPIDDDQVAFSFEYEGRTYLCITNPNDPEYLSIGLPVLKEVTEEQMPHVFQWMNHINANLKYAKTYMDDMGVWIWYERMVTEQEDTDEVLIRIILNVENALNTFDELIEKDMDDDDDDDYSDDDDADADIDDIDTAADNADTDQ